MGEPTELRETFETKSPLRAGSGSKYKKKEANIKNHKKCLELCQISIEVAHYDSIEALTVSYIINKSIEKEFCILKESTKKDYSPTTFNSSFSKTDDSFINELNTILNQELSHLAMMN